MFISFILPCYNVREYISDSLHSVINSAIKSDVEYEIVIVNDGSTDSTMVEVSRIVKNHPDVNFKVINKPNGGLSSARNAGLQVASGEYVFLLDSDDFILPENFLALVDEMKNVRADIYTYGFYWYERENSYWESDVQSLPFKTLIKDKSVWMSSLYRDKQFYAWMRVVKRSLYDGVLFPEGRNFEDIATTPLLMSKAASVYYFPCPVVCYRQRKGSIVKTKSLKNALNLSSSVPFQKNFSSCDERYSWLELSMRVYLWSVSDLFKSDVERNQQKISFDGISEDFNLRFSADNLKFFTSECIRRGEYKLSMNALVASKLPLVRFVFMKVFRSNG